MNAPATPAQQLAAQKDGKATEDTAGEQNRQKDGPKGGSRSRKQDDEDATKRESSLKGTWRVESVTGGEKSFAVIEHNDLVFVGERVLMVPSDPGDTTPPSVFRFHLGAKRPLREVDLYQKANDDGSRFLGVFDVKGNELRLCLSNRTGTRSASLEPTKRQALIVARKVDLDDKPVDSGGGTEKQKPPAPDMSKILPKWSSK
jgi:uncharacterized protein (TIGR03067 family)